MATAGTHPTPTEHPRAREERERAHKSATEHPQQASAEIDEARHEATAGVGRSLDSALERMRDVSGELRQPAEAKPLSGRTRSSMRVIRLAARWAAAAIRAQRKPEAPKELSDEIRKQKTKLGRRRRRATVPRANRRSPAGGTGPPAKRLRRMPHPERCGRPRRRAAGERATGRSRQTSLAALDVMVVDA